MNINFRVFRRNNKNLILLWNNTSLSDDQRSCIAAFEAPGGLEDDRELTWSKFVPDNPEKFAPDVDGIVVPHASNRLNPSEACTVKVVLGSGEDSLEMVKEVLPANSVVEPARPPEPKRVHMYAMDYSRNVWVPWPHDGVIPSNVTISIKDA